MPVDYHVHCIAHGERKSKLENYLPYIQQARSMGIKELGFAEHDEYLETVDYEVLKALKTQMSEVKIKIGIEMEMPNDQSGFQKLLKYPLDYVIASIHILDDWMFDHPDYQERYKMFDDKLLYRMYFEKLATLLSWDGYNIIGHLDLIKIFGLRSSFNFKPLLEGGLKTLCSEPKAVEINTAGKYKPIAEIYPAPDIIKWLFELNVPVTLSSDAHRAEDVGRDNALAVEMLKKIGYRKIAIFTERKRYFINL